MSNTFESLTSRNPKVTPEELLDTFVLSHRFRDVSFDTYKPDPNFLSQAEARSELWKFAVKLAKKQKFFGKFAKNKGPAGMYLDGGFGVGKTHLLTSLWKVAPGPKAIGTFIEYTNLVGALGFHKAVSLLKNHSLVCIDEFELDDPGDTVLMSRLMRELADAGVKLAATSNTLPGALGEGRFAAEDFKREIQVLSSQFEVLRIDGNDYRHQENVQIPGSKSTDELKAITENNDENETVSYDDFSELIEHLGKVHPSRYKTLIEGLKTVYWKDVVPFKDQDKALRFVVLVDRLYDAETEIIYSGTDLQEIFPAEMLTSGYQKKFYRSLSRLGTMVV
ncbi:MAG: cell division protein ZapE [Micrococcaceae bacterium]